MSDASAPFCSSYPADAQEFDSSLPIFPSYPNPEAFPGGVFPGNFNNPCPVVEQSTLVYTLVDEKNLPWEHFDLIVRSLHGFKLQRMQTNKAQKSITVKVGYFANMENTRKRLGGASKYIQVSRMPTNVKVSELQTLAELRAKFGLGGGNAEEEPETPAKAHKKRKYAPSN